MVLMSACGDNSDEFNCKYYKHGNERQSVICDMVFAGNRVRPAWHECEEGMFRCNNGNCITMKRVYDNKNHCGDGSVELASCGMLISYDTVLAEEINSVMTC